MPLLKIETNISLKSDEKDELLEKASKLASQILGKPESYVMTGIHADKHMQFAGTTEPCAYVEFKSLGLDESKTGEYSAAICNLLETESNINSARIYIEFTNAERHLWGWNNSTF